MKLKQLLTESEIKEARVIDPKAMATKMVDLVFGNVGTEATPMFKDGQGANKFREALIFQIAGAIKGVIRKHARQDYFMGDTKNVWK